MISHRSDDGDNVRLALAGDLDASVAESTFEAMLTALKATATLEVDLSSVTFLDSTALRVLCDAQQRAERIGARVLVVNPSSVCVRLLVLTGLAHYFGLDPDQGLPPLIADGERVRRTRRA